MSRYLSKRFDGVAPYVPGEQPQGRQYVKLNTNESPFPPAPGVIEAMSRAERERLHLYPDPDTREAAEAIAAYYGLRRENVLLGNGSDELLSFSFQAFCDAEVPACFPNLSYGFYKVFARMFCLPTKVIPVDAETLQLDPADYWAADGTIFIANPNAPTGQTLKPKEIESILQTNPDNVVIVDEAYVDFGAESCVPLLQKYDNLLVIQTMSKSRSLAGARLGFALGGEALITDLNTMKFGFNPYNINRLSLLAAVEAIRDRDYFTSCTRTIMENRAYTVQQLQKRGFTVLPSQANFVFTRPNFQDGGEYYRNLKEKGVLVRHFDDSLVTDYVRISIGAREQMDALLAATDELIEEAQA